MAIKPWCVIFPSGMLNKSNFLSAWAIATNQSQQVFGLTLGGEFSTAINDCGLWYVCIFLSDDNAEGSSDTSFSCRLSGIGSTPSSPDCAVWDDWAVCIVTRHSTCPWSSNLITSHTMPRLLVASGKSPLHRWMLYKIPFSGRGR